MLSWLLTVNRCHISSFTGCVFVAKGQNAKEQNPAVPNIVRCACGRDHSVCALVLKKLHALGPKEAAEASLCATARAMSPMRIKFLCAIIIPLRYQILILGINAPVLP